VYLYSGIHVSKVLENFTRCIKFGVFIEDVEDVEYSSDYQILRKVSAVFSYLRTRVRCEFNTMCETPYVWLLYILCKLGQILPSI
jgi:hypothetical protein